MSLSAEEQIRAVLYSKEQLIWAGRSRNSLRFNFLMIVPLLFLLVWTGSGLRIAVLNYLADDHTPADVLFPLGMASIGLALFAYILVIGPRHQRKIAYGLTTERGLIVGGLFNRTMVSMPLEFMHTVTMRARRDSSGTLIFKDFVHRCGEDADDLCPYEFLDIEAVQDVHALITDARDRLHASRRECFLAAS